MPNDLDRLVETHVRRPRPPRLAVHDRNIDIVLVPEPIPKFLP